MAIDHLIFNNTNYYKLSHLSLIGKHVHATNKPISAYEINVDYNGNRNEIIWNNRSVSEGAEIKYVLLDKYRVLLDIGDYRFNNTADPDAGTTNIYNSPLYIDLSELINKGGSIY